MFKNNKIILIILTIISFSLFHSCSVSMINLLKYQDGFTTEKDSAQVTGSINYKMYPNFMGDSTKNNDMSDMSLMIQPIGEVNITKGLGNSFNFGAGMVLAPYILGGNLFLKYSLFDTSSWLGISTIFATNGAVTNIFTERKEYEEDEDGYNLSASGNVQVLAPISFKFGQNSILTIAPFMSRNALSYSHTSYISRDYDRNIHFHTNGFYLMYNNIPISGHRIIPQVSLNNVANKYIVPTFGIGIQLPVE